MSGNQSRYKEIVQGGVEQDKIDCVYLFFAKKNEKQKYKRDIMQLYSADATMF